MYTEIHGKTRTQIFVQKERKEVKRQGFLYRDTTNVGPKIYDFTSNNWSHWNSNEKFKKKFGICTRKIFDRSSTNVNYTWNITNYTESTAV